jgi:hypothetical protein
VRRVQSHLTYANVVSTMCLFLLLGGTAWAAATITGKDVRNESLTGRDIKNGSIKGRDIANNDVTTNDIRKGTINTSDVGEGSLNSGDIADGSLLAKDFKLGQLPAGTQGPKGEPGATGPKGDTGATGPGGTGGGSSGLSNVTTRRVEQVFPANQPIAANATVTAACLAGERATGGDGEALNSSGQFRGETFISRSRPVPSATGTTPTGWQTQITGDSGRTLQSDVTVVAYAICAS